MVRGGWDGQVAEAPVGKHPHPHQVWEVAMERR